MSYHHTFTCIHILPPNIQAHTCACTCAHTPTHTDTARHTAIHFTYTSCAHLRKQAAYYIFHSLFCMNPATSR